MFSKYLLTSAIGFVIGLLIFYLLSVIVVHLGGFLQKEISTSQWSKDRPFTGYTRFLLKDIVGSKRLHSYTFRFINPFTKISFPSIGIRKIDRLVIFLNTFRYFYLPFLVCGFVFLFFSFEIKGYLPFDLPNTFYSTIQENLLALHEIPLLWWLRQYKIWINLFLGLLIILVPLFFIYRKRLKVGIKRFNQILIYIAILTNVTFFSGVTANVHQEVDQKLTDICLKIEEVHKRIFQKGGALGVYDYVDDVEENFKEYEKTLQELENNVLSNRYSLGDEPLGQELEASLREYLDSTQKATIKYQNFSVPLFSEEQGTEYFKKIREFAASQSETTEPLDYLYNEEKWTYNEGINVETKLDKHIADIQAKTRPRDPSSKGSLIIEEFYNAFSSFGVGIASDLLTETTSEIAKALLKSISKATKEDILNQITSSLKGIRSGSKKKLVIDKKIQNDIKNQYNSIVNNYNRKDDELSRQIEDMEEQLRAQMKKGLADEIIQNIKTIDFDNIKLATTFYKGKTIRIESISKLKAAIDAVLTDQSSMQNKIIKTYTNSVATTNVFDLPTFNRRNKREYINNLKRVNTNKELQSNKPFVEIAKILNHVPAICPCCFQDTRRVKVCVPLNPLCLR